MMPLNEKQLEIRAHFELHNQKVQQLIEEKEGNEDLQNFLEEEGIQQC